MLITKCQHANLNLDFVEGLPTGPPHDQTFTCWCTINDEKFPEAKGKSKKEAKKLAAKNAFDELEARCPNKPQDSIVSDSSKSSNPDSQNGDTNYVGKLNEYCNARGIKFAFEKIKQDGPSHKPKLVYCAVVDNKVYKEAEGKNKKVAKQKAAQLALEEMPTTSWTMEDTPKLEESLKNDQSKCKTKKEISLAPNFSRKPVNEQNKQEVDSVRFFEMFDNISELGKGGYGCVFKARHKVDCKYYAVKKVKLHKGKAVSEVLTLADLNHPNVVRYYTSWEERATFYADLSETATNSSENCKILCEALFIKMELCEKGTLKNWIDERKGKDIDKSESLGTFQQIVEGVKYIHSKGLIHRDLKPSNIFLDEEMNIKIGDFGLVTTINLDRDRTKGVGTRTYMSPEQKNLSNKYGWEVDIFALGLIFFELLRLYSTENEKSKEWDNIRNRKFTDDFKEKYPKEVKLLHRMLSETPTKRPSAQDILSSLQEKEPTSIKTY
ncbi:hypothetical protein NDU88_007874 [Pleurodeles waltl]|uniref:non-specific serine/threonine protein kinase n=1 Tax=Pleurodeles waltl TaxID=8319 RepID=A0AAV7RS73_PLEWA|nr:hypothetical protein NDU88_007874 [Pleurodeles waltl]